jgi:hypothetical protein
LECGLEARDTADRGESRQECPLGPKEPAALVQEEQQRHQGTAGQQQLDYQIRTQLLAEPAKHCQNTHDYLLSVH